MAAGAGLPPAATAPAAPPRLAVDFASGVPDLASFPRGDWAWAVREACRGAPNAALDYGDPRGSAVLREVVAAYLRRVRAAAADPDRIVVCTGFAQGLILVLRALAQSGIRDVAVEDPGYSGTVTAAAAAAGVAAVPVPVDEAGIDVDRLAATGARACVLTPAHQWPSGVVLTAARRQQLAAGRPSATRSSSRMTTTPSSATTASRSARCRAWPRTGSSRSARSASRWRPALRLGWLVCPPALAGP